MGQAPGARTHRTDTPHKENHVNTTPAARTAARAINAHPWLSAVYPEIEDTDLLITPPYPSQVDDTAHGHIEGRATWHHNADGTVTYHVAIAYEGRGGTAEDETTAVIDPLTPLAWVDLARTVAELVDQLDRELTADAIFA